MKKSNIKNNLSWQRSQIIEWFINIEWLINAIICQRYLKKVYKEFLFEVLYDEYFTTGLKIRILEKIIEPSHKTLLDKLRRLNTIRNYFAHLKLSVIRGPIKIGPLIAPDPRNLEKSVDFTSLFKEFQENNDDVTRELAEIYQKMGGILEK